MISKFFKLKKTVFFLLICLIFAFTSCKNATKNYVSTDIPLSRNGVNIHLDCMTLDGADIKDNILLVHGLTYSSHEFDVDYQDYSLVRFLCRNGYAVWRLDISGYGQSDRVANGFDVNSEYASLDIACAIDKIIEITGVENIDLLGWSWGTITAALAEQKRSSCIDKLVLYAPLMSGLGEAEVTSDYHLNDWENAASDFQRDDNGEFDDDITDPVVRDIYCSNCWKYDKEDSPAGGRVDFFVDSSVELIDLSKIASPTLVICGDVDPYLNYSLVNNCLEKLPEDSKLVVVPGASHCLFIEKPYYHEFQKELIEFLT